MFASHPRNILFVDTNQQRVSATSEAGFPTASIDVSTTPFLMAWPSQIISKEADLSSGEFVVYISEFLGRIWKWSLTLHTDGEDIGSVDFSRSGIPSLIVDKSIYPVSIHIRKILHEAKASGIASYDKLFFEVSN